MLPVDFIIGVNDTVIQAFDQFIQSIDGIQDIIFFFPVNQDCIIWDIVDVRLVNVVSTNVLVIALNMQYENFVV
jgi:hypothetical protein